MRQTFAGHQAKNGGTTPRSCARPTTRRPTCPPQSTAECDTISTIAGNKRVWIDLNWDDSESRWEFSDNTQPSYTRWAGKTGFADGVLDNGVGRNGDYVYLQTSGRSKSRSRGAVGNGDAKWVDVSLKKKCAVVCQKDYS